MLYVGSHQIRRSATKNKLKSTNTLGPNTCLLQRPKNESYTKPKSQLLENTPRNHKILQNLS